MEVRPFRDREDAREPLAAGLERLPGDLDALALEVLAGNAVGTAFYEARGFERVGASTVEVAGEDDPRLVYRRPLGDDAPGETKR